LFTHLRLVFPVAPFLLAFHQYSICIPLLPQITSNNTRAANWLFTELIGILCVLLHDYHLPNESESESYVTTDSQSASY
jgi:hypothetical protein